MSEKNNLPLCILDEYAKRLSDKQVAKLYEHVNGKPYEKSLFEKKDETAVMRMHLNETVTVNSIYASNAELLLHLNENHGDAMKNIRCRLNEDEVEFIAPSRKDYSDLLKALHQTGFSKETLKSIKDKKY